LPEFERYNAQLLGISVDNVWSHKAYAESRNLKFPLLADFHPKGAVGRQYGTYNEEKGTEWRDLYVIDGEGVIRWSYRSPGGVNPGAAGILSALEALESGDGTEERK
jgi:peroxiredoxin (alkyl hydroperoxide reductase subunit C)